MSVEYPKKWVLLVESESDAREGTKELLEKIGEMTVIIADSVVDATEKLRTYKDRIGALVTNCTLKDAHSGEKKYTDGFLLERYIRTQKDWDIPTVFYTNLKLDDKRIAAESGILKDKIHIRGNAIILGTSLLPDALIDCTKAMLAKTYIAESKKPRQR